MNDTLQCCAALAGGERGGVAVRLLPVVALRAGGVRRGGGAVQQVLVIQVIQAAGLAGAAPARRDGEVRQAEHALSHQPLHPPEE